MNRRVDVLESVHHVCEHVFTICPVYTNMTIQAEIIDQANETSLMQVEHEVFMPALSIEQALQRFNAVVEFVRTVMREGVDYGVIPGTDKPTLLKPGAEKLCTLFGLTSRFEIIRAVEDWTGEHHNGAPFFFYLYRCQLCRGDIIISEGDGSCNSWEQKYRYREAQRKCPQCEQTTIIRGKEEYGGGRLCFRKRGGCGAKFRVDDPAIADQQAGRVQNENIADQVNTIQKMAQKRCLVAATLLAVNGSEFFTQDGDEFTTPQQPVAAPSAARSSQEHSASEQATAAGFEVGPISASVEPGFVERIKEEKWQCTPAQKQMIVNLLSQIIAQGVSEQDMHSRIVADYGVASPASLAPSVVPLYLDSLKQALRT